MVDAEPIQLRTFTRRNEGTASGHSATASQTAATPSVTAFTRQELSAILAVYGRLMADGTCRDYALDFGRETAIFSMFRRASEVPLYRVEKTPKLSRRQGAFSVVTATGLILKRGHELPRVLDVLVKNLRAV